MKIRPASRYAILLGAMLFVACGRDDLPRQGTSIRLIGDEYSELRYSPLSSLRDRVAIDFTTPAGAKLVRLGAADGEQRRDGLLVRPQSTDPIVSFPDPVLGFNRVTVMMRSSKSGTIEVFWAGDGEEFAAKRSRRLPVRRSDQFEEYMFDLSADLAEDRGPYRLRIDPLDQQAPFLLKRIELARAQFYADAGPGEEPLARKVRLGKEVREALVVPAGRVVSKPVTLPAESALSFAVGRARRNTADLHFRLAFREDGGAVTVLLEEELSAADAARWNNHELSLRSLGGQRGRLEASARVVEGGAGEGGVAFWANPTLSGGREGRRRPNVILISLDTLGSSHLTAYGAQGVADEFLTRIVGQGAVFENSFAASSLTHISHGSLLTGKGPLEGNLFWLGGGSIEEDTLADELRRLGYATAAFTGGVLVTESLGFDRGFERFHQQDTLNEEPLRRTDIHELLRLAESWIADTPFPWFAFVHSYEVHTPYYRRTPADDGDNVVPGQYFNVVHMKGLNPQPVSATGRYLKRLDRGGNEITREGQAIEARDMEELRRVYASEIAFLDRALDRFFAGLESRGLLADTVVVVTSDHGEAFFEHHLLEHGLLYDENLRVPLIVSAPGRVPEGVRVAAPVTALDVVPTILDLVGARPERAFEGRSLVGAMHGRKLAPVPSYAFVPGNGLAVTDGVRRKLIWRLALLNENYGRHELFDRVSDPGELNDLLAAPGGDDRRLAAAAAGLVQRIPGAHISLDELAGETCSLELEGDQVNPDRLYAVEMNVRRPMSDLGSGRWGGVVRFARHPRLIVMGAPPAGWLKLRARCGEGRDAEFRIDLTRLDATPRPVGALGGTASIAAWKVPSTGAGTQRGGFTEEELENLRSLGYLR